MRKRQGLQMVLPGSLLHRREGPRPAVHWRWRNAEPRGGVATADSGTINTGLFAAADPARRGAFLALHAISGFGASAISPVLFGLLLDLAGGSQRALAWIIAFAAQAAINMLWPLSYVVKR